MGFVSPWFLAGIAAAALPLWLHLLRRFKRTPQPFSSVMFFERRLEASSKQRRLRELALLALRLALLVFIALAFANPFVNRNAASASRRKLTVIAIDRSFSMRYGNRMEEAKARAQELVNELGANDLAEVLAVDAHVEAMTQPVREHRELSAAIDDIQPTDLPSSYGELTRVLRVMDASMNMRLEVHFIGDMQQTSMPPAFSDLVPGPHTSIALERVGDADPPNWAVVSVSAPAQVFASEPERIVATVAGWETPSAEKTVTLVLDGKTIMSKRVEVPANGKATVEFAGVEIPFGQHRGEVVIEPHDELAADDLFFFATEQSDARKVLFFYADGRPSEALYYKTAIESAPAAGLKVETARVEEADSIDLSKFSYVVLNDVAELDAARNRALCDWVSKGGALLIAAGRKAASVGRVPVSGMTASPGIGFKRATMLTPDDAAITGISEFKNVTFSRYSVLTPKAGDRIIARFEDGTPLLVEEQMGEGRLLVFASTLDGEGSDFPLHASFVPFVLQTGRYLAGETDRASSMVSGTAVELRQGPAGGAATDVIGPDGKHELNFKEAATARVFSLDRSGFYRIERAGGEKLLVAANADRRESDLTPIPDETLALWRNTGNAAAASAGSVERQVRSRTFWRYLLIAALAAALAESIFGGRYLKRGREAA
jgi:hypothetical protein